MKTSFESKIANAQTLLDVLLILKDKTLMDTHVASLAYLRANKQSFNGKYGIWQCSPFPLYEDQPEYQIQAYYFSEQGDNFVPNQMVLVVFTDNNFISNLESVDAQPKTTYDNILHSSKYGVIVSLPGIELTPAEKEEILDF